MKIAEAANELHPLAAMLLDELQWMREQFSELPPSPGTDIMQSFLDDLEAEAAALDAQLAVGPIPLADLTQIGRRVALRVDATRKALEPVDDRLHFLLLSGGSVILTWCNEVAKAISNAQAV